MDYFSIFKEAWQITWKHKFLWIFGLFVGGASFTVPNFQYNLASQDLDFIQMSQLQSFLSKYSTVILIIIISVIFLAILMWIFSFIAQGSMIGGVSDIYSQKKTTFKSAFMIGWHNFWRVLALSIIIGLYIFIIILILSLPVFLLAITGLTITAIILGILFFLLFLAFIFISSLAFNYSYRILIIKKTGIIKSLVLGYSFFKKFWKEILLIFLITMGISLAWALALLILLLIIGSVLFLIGLFLYSLIKSAILVYIIISLLILFIPLIILSAGYKTFISAVWTISYLKLKKSFK